MIDSYIYTKKRHLLNKAEHRLYNILLNEFGHKYYIYPQMHLETLAYFDHNGRRNHAAMRHIDEKRVDYVICNKSDIKPLLVVELDGPHHKDPDRLLRDKFVNNFMKEINLPILHIPYLDYNSLDATIIKTQVEKKINGLI